MSHLKDILRSSKPFQIARSNYRQKRVAAGLAPDLVPHSEYVRMRDGTLLWTTYWDPRLSSTEQLPTLLVRSPYTVLGTQNMADLYVPFGFAVVEQASWCFVFCFEI
jgi:predicted acyl esterase